MNKNILYIIVFIFSINIIYSQPKTTDGNLSTKHSIEKIIDSLNIVISVTKDTVKAKALIELSMYYRENDELNKAVYTLKKSLELLENYEDKKAIIYNKIGLLYYYMGDFSNSLDYQFKALKIINKLKNSNNTDIYTSIGMAFTRLKKYDKAVSFFNKSLDIAETKKDTAKILYLKSNIGTVYIYQEKYKKASDYYDKLIVEYGDKAASKPAICNNIATISLHLKNYKKSQEYYEKSIKLSGDDKYSLSKIYQNMGDLFYEQKKYDSAYKYYSISLNYSKITNGKSVRLNNYDDLTKLFINKLQIDSALIYYEKYKLLRDTIFNSEYNEKLTKIETRYDLELKDQKIKQLETEKNLSEIRYTRYVLSLILVIIILIVFSLLIYLRNKRLATDKFIVKQNLKLVKYEDNIKEPDNEDIDKYKTSNLDEELKTKLELEISRKFIQEKLYLKTDLSISYLAELFNTNRNNISQVINERFDKNFNNFVNEYRIKEAVRLLSKHEYEKYTLESISKKVGFNSISVFNNSFKKIVGVTPSTFIKSIKETK